MNWNKWVRQIHRSVHVRASVCHQVAQRATHRLTQMKLEIMNLEIMNLYVETPSL